jgi:hypothetical protein
MKLTALARGDGMPKGAGNQEPAGNQAAMLKALKALATAAEPYCHCGCSGLELARAYEAAQQVIDEAECPSQEIWRGFR